MTKKKRHLITIDDITDNEIKAIFSLADKMEDNLQGYSDLCKGMVMASLFYEPSTRTRLSFETAMHRLGGSVVTAVDVNTTSIAKGETLADTARVVSSYVDIIVVRHPWEGAARVVADYSSVPVINAGDGSHEHPTQSLCDLYTLKREKGKIRNLNIALCGDLKGARTIHSLTYALARFGAEIKLIASGGFELPDFVKDRLIREYRATVIESKDNATEPFKEMDAVYQTHPQLPMLPAETETEINLRVKMPIGPGKRNARLDVVYASRMQKERHTTGNTASNKRGLRLDKRFMRRPQFRNALIMHPLPRVDEIDYDLDENPRSIYFKQAAYGVPVRMALLSSLLGVSRPQVQAHHGSIADPNYPPYKSDAGIRCPNPTCVSNQESAYIVPEFLQVDDKPTVLRCRYCQWEIKPKAAGSRRTKVFHKVGRHPSRRLHDGNLVYFKSYNEARKRGYRPGYRVPGAEMENERQSDPD